MISEPRMNAMHTRTLKFMNVAQYLLIAGCLVFASGCSLYRAQKSFESGRYEQAVEQYREILQRDPTHIKARIGLRRASIRASEEHLNAANRAHQRGQEELVEKEVRTAYMLDPSNAVAQDWIARIELAKQRQQAQGEDESLESQRDRANAKSPILLNPRSLEGMDLNFTRKTNLRDIFAAIQKNSGVSIILHNSVPQDISVSADLRGISFQRILDTLMLQSDLFYKVVAPNTIMVFKDSAQNRQNYENQLIKTFYLSNAVVDDVRTVFTTLMPLVKVVPDKRLNAITIKAKPTDMTIATRIVDRLDKAKAEVMVYLELLEVTETNLERVGLLPTLDPMGNTGVYRIGATLSSTDLGSPNTNTGALRISKSDVKFLFPSLALDALKSSGDAKLVASPNIRVVSGEEGQVNIGEKHSTMQGSFGTLGTGLGSTTSTSTATSALGGFSGVGNTYSYEEIGVKIKVKPRVHFNNDVTLEVESEVTTLAASSNPDHPNIGRRNIKTQARLQDGETAVFGGLLKEDEQKSLQGIWGLSDIPVIGKLFGNNSKTATKTDVILTIRTVLVRKADLGEEDMEAFDPDLATSEHGPFVAKIKKNTAETQTPAPEAPKPPVIAPHKAPEPSKVTPEAPKAVSELPKTTVDNKEALAVPDLAAAATASSSGSSSAAEAQDLVLFLTPLTSTIKTNEHLQLTLMVSGGNGLGNGFVELKLDPTKVKVASVTAGDYLTTEGGSVDQMVKPDGTVRINFRRATTTSDSGTLAVIELEALQAGNAPVLIQSGQYLVNGNPIPAKVVNALVTVE
jgi:general secretion pathway protein D